MIIFTKSYYIYNKNMYSRSISDKIKSRVDSGKAIVVIGPRQVGKTTLVEKILESKDYLLLPEFDSSWAYNPLKPA